MKTVFVTRATAAQGRERVSELTAAVEALRADNRGLWLDLVHAHELVARLVEHHGGEVRISHMAMNMPPRRMYRWDDPDTRDTVFRTDRPK